MVALARLRQTGKTFPGDVVRFGDEGKVCFPARSMRGSRKKARGRSSRLAFHGPVLDEALANAASCRPAYIAARRA
jgi:S-adenosylmethionine:tRNA ribosyltransferase-isomerase